MCGRCLPQNVTQTPPRSVCICLKLFLIISGSSLLASETTKEECVISGEQSRHLSRYLYYENQQLPIALEDSGRVSHKVINHILMILLQDVAGYKDVKIIYCHNYDRQNITVQLNRIAGRIASRHCQPPHKNPSNVAETMVNMEAWMYAGMNYAQQLSTAQLIDTLPLGPQSRLGWYVPTSVVEKLWRDQNIIVDHWKAFQVPNVARRFSLWGNTFLNSVEINYRMKAYRNPKCHDNAKGQRKKCGTLFAAYKDIYSSTLQSQVENLNLYVDIVWLEDYFNTFIRDCERRNQTVLFFTWRPSPLTATGKFTRISLPETHSDHEYYPKDTDFPSNQLTKVIWAPLKPGAPEAHHIITKMTFNDSEYEQIIAKIPEDLTGSSLHQVACEWVQLHQAVWENWLPAGVLEKTKLYLAGLFPLSGRTWSQPGLVQGAKLALQRVNLDPNTLPNHILDLLVADTECEHDVAISKYISMAVESIPPVVGILGTGCSNPAERIAAISKHFYTLMVSYGAEAQDLSDRSKYPYFFRTVPPVHHYSDLACRNCLVHSNKTVKIGDFGMTRHVNSTDYYRFSRKGMLPVRWTAPEALKDGIYSAKSDIWSFGVLVFEIVTFGSFPYQGLSNKEVFDYVSSGKQLLLPHQFPADLKSFIYWCMSTDPGYRPDLDDILSYLNFSPSFLTPCLDAPTTSVVHEDTDSMEMPLPSFPHAGGMEHDLTTAWYGKLNKNKTSSTSGMLLNKSGRSSLTRRSPKSSRSSSVCTENLYSTHTHGLQSSPFVGNFDTGLSLDTGGNLDSVFSDNKTGSGSRLKYFDSEVTLNSPGDRSIALCDRGRGQLQQQSLPILSHHANESSSGNLSHDSKPICQTVTSL